MVSGTRGNAVKARQAALELINEWRATAGLEPLKRREVFAMTLRERLDAMRDARAAADAAWGKAVERDLGRLGKAPLVLVRERGLFQQNGAE